MGQVILLICIIIELYCYPRGPWRPATSMPSSRPERCATFEFTHIYIYIDISISISLSIHIYIYR